MIVSINQPAYLPWLGYFNRIAKSDLHVVLDQVQFEKNSFINRNKILLNKSPIWLTLPLLTKGKFGNLDINSIAINQTVNWKKKHWLTIEQAYASANHWLDFKSSLKEVYEIESNRLIDVLKLSLNFFLQHLDIKTPIVFASDYHFESKKSDLILEICERFGAKQYLSGPLGRNYLEEKKFKEANIEIIYDDYQHPIYKQQSENFIPYMSTLDLLVNYGKQSLGILKNV